MQRTQPRTLMHEYEPDEIIWDWQEEICLPENTDEIFEALNRWDEEEAVEER